MEGDVISWAFFTSVLKKVFCWPLCVAYFCRTGQWSPGRSCQPEVHLQEGLVASWERTSSQGRGSHAYEARPMSRGFDTGEERSAPQNSTKALVHVCVWHSLQGDHRPYRERGRGGGGRSCKWHPSRHFTKTSRRQRDIIEPGNSGFKLQNASSITY